VNPDKPKSKFHELTLVVRINSNSSGKKKDDLFVFKLFCPQAGLALPFPFDEKEAKILSKRTLSRAF